MEAYMQRKSIYYEWAAKHELIPSSTTLRPIVTYWRHMASEIWAYIASGNGLLPDGTEPIPERMIPFMITWGL